MPAARGFTLVEMLVVMVIIAVAGGTVLLMAGGGAPRQLQGGAQRIVQLVQQLSEQAMREQRPYGLWMDAQGYQVLQWQAADARWQAVTAWPPRRLPAGIALALEQTGGQRPLPAAVAAAAADGKLPQVLIGADQQWSPFSLQLSGAAQALRVHSDGLNGPLIQPVGAP